MELTPGQQMFVEIICVWLPLSVYAGFNLAFLADLLGFYRVPKGTFDNIIAIFMVAPTVMVIVTIFSICKAIEFKFYKKRIEEKHKNRIDNGK